MSKQWPTKEQETWFQAGVTGERERILQIVSWLFPSRPNEPIDRLIALIKGEQK